MYELLGPIAGALLGAAATFLLTRRHKLGDLRQRNTLLEREIANATTANHNLSSELSRANQRMEELTHFQHKYMAVRGKLKESSVVRNYDQPVLLVGPRAVGKTSLLKQWHSPWDHSILEPTRTHQVSTVPVFDFKRENVEPHFADPDILTDVHVHLRLRVHDFPGEMAAQLSVIEHAKAETKELRQKTGKSLGIVVICMLDASEASSSLSQATLSYYNGDLFARLRELVARTHVGMERLVLVFNKYDLLRDAVRDADDVGLMRSCIACFGPVLSLLKGVCNSERVCEVFTVLSRGDAMVYNNRGAPIVLGEAARRFVEAMAGVEAAAKVVREEGTTYTAPVFE